MSTSFVYDRNRLLTATTGGVAAAYNYDPFGRLNTVTSAGQVVESYSYDGFDRIAEHTSIDETGATESTSYSYDPLDRTTSRTDAAGETTDYTYLGLSGEVLAEEIAGQVQKSYQYSPWGKRLSQITHNTDGSAEDAYYGYNPHTDVETLTGDDGDPVSTYGYTAYGSNDEAEFTGIDAPDPGTPGDEPYNVYRYNAKRWDPVSGTYDMGFRDYNPGINRFLSRDMYTGALADLNLGMSPWTANRYAFTGGNPITGIELDGHRICEIDCMSGDAWYDPTTGTIHDPAEVDSAGSNNTSSGSDPSDLDYADVEWECPQVYGGVVFINPFQALSFLFGNGGDELDFGGGDCTGSSGFDGGGFDSGGFDGGGFDGGGGFDVAKRGETYSRTMSSADFDELSATGRLPATSETFISPTREFS